MLESQPRKCQAPSIFRVLWSEGRASLPGPTAAPSPVCILCHLGQQAREHMRCVLPLTSKAQHQLGGGPLSPGCTDQWQQHVHRIRGDFFDPLQTTEALKPSPRR